MFVIHNPLMKSFTGLFHIWFSTQPIDYYPLTYSSIWLDYHLWGLSATGYHGVNLLLHCANALFLSVIFRKLNIPFAGFAALLFAIHPVNVQSVAWITERKNVLCMFWFCLCVLNFLTFEKKQTPKNYLIALGCFCLALLCKAAVLMFPIVILCYHWWKKNQLTRRDLLLSTPFFYISAIMGGVSLWFQSHRAIGETIVRNDTVFSRCLNSLLAVGFYIQKSILPVQLSFVYPINQNQFPLPMALPGLLLITIVLLYCLYKRNRGGLFGLLYIFWMLFPVLGFVDIYFMRYAWVADHWQYFSIVGVLAFLMVGIDLITKKIGDRYVHCGFILWAGCFAILTFNHVQQFKDETTLWLSTLSTYPDCALALNRLGSIHQSQNDLAGASMYYQLTLTYHPDNATAHNNLGMIEASRGYLEKAEKHYSAAILHHPQHPNSHYNMGCIQMKLGHFDLAEKNFQTCLSIQPGHEAALIWLATCLEFQKKWMSASKVYETLIQQFGERPDFLNSLARTYEATQHHFQSLRYYQDSLKIQPDQPEIYYQMALIYQRMGRIQNAITCGKKAVDLDSEYPPYALFLALIIGEHGSLDEAVQYLSIGLQINEHYQQTAHQLKMQKRLNDYVQEVISEREKKHVYWENNPEQWYQLGNLYLVTGDQQNAQNAFQKTLEKDPSHVRAGHNLAWIYALNKKQSESIHVFSELINHHPNECAWIYYQMARLCALFKDDTCDYHTYLEKALHAGFRNVDMLYTDPLFQGIEFKQKNLLFDQKR
ncbi:MAG: tetratricopeptide repeat protein [Candidatus Magnetomorum sp.]|nr:tetratricopeptide repeat protein [Candidatus Magnetomorum sp.]